LVGLALMDFSPVDLSLTGFLRLMAGLLWWMAGFLRSTVMVAAVLAMGRVRVPQTPCKRMAGAIMNVRMAVDRKVLIEAGRLF
jgi:hypothetical protein